MLTDGGNEGETVKFLVVGRNGSSIGEFGKGATKLGIVGMAIGGTVGKAMGGMMSCNDGESWPELNSVLLFTLLLTLKAIPAAIEATAIAATTDIIVANDDAPALPALPKPFPAPPDPDAVPAAAPATTP